MVHAARNGFFYALDRTNGSFVAGKQYSTAELGAGPRSQDRQAAQLQSERRRPDLRRRQPRHARAGRTAKQLCPAHTGGKNWEPSAYNPELGLLYIPSIEGCNYIDTVAQKDFADQGGTVKPRERFSGGGTKITGASLRQPQGDRSDTGDIKAALKLAYPNYTGVLATAGNLVFIGNPDGTFSAYDAKTLAGAVELQCRHRHQRAADHLCGQRQAVHCGAGGIAAVAECHSVRAGLKNTSTASMLFVFAL